MIIDGFQVDVDALESERGEAMRRARRWFFPKNKPCAKGHDAPRYTDTTFCVVCEAESKETVAEVMDIQETIARRLKDWLQSGKETALTRLIDARDQEAAIFERVMHGKNHGD